VEAGGKSLRNSILATKASTSLQTTLVVEAYWLKRIMMMMMMIMMMMMMII
jgi:hypothetical protein